MLILRSEQYFWKGGRLIFFNGKQIKALLGDIVHLAWKSTSSCVFLHLRVCAKKTLLIVASIEVFLSEIVCRIAS